MALVNIYAPIDWFDLFKNTNNTEGYKKIT